MSMPEDDEEYAIVSKKEFSKLETELDKFKKNPFEGSSDGASMQDSMSNLNGSMNTMMEVFKSAADELNLETHDTELITKQMGPIQEKLDLLTEQNQKIAKGIVAIAEMVKEKFEAMEEKLDNMKKEPMLSKPAQVQVDKKPLPQFSGGPNPRMSGPVPPMPRSAPLGFDSSGFEPMPSMPGQEPMGPPGQAPPQGFAPGMPELPPLDDQGMGPPPGAVPMGQAPPPAEMGELPPLNGGPAPMGSPGQVPPLNAPPQEEKKSILGGLLKK
ncbi:hypothetical protein HON01_03060 [Candidatus Woesearchaeota archaeon]|nr:hypothetical protein [Candidatus Woesearchaeota archaeon]